MRRVEHAGSALSICNGLRLPLVIVKRIHAPVHSVQSSESRLGLSGKLNGVVSKHSTLRHFLELGFVIFPFSMMGCASSRASV